MTTVAENETKDTTNEADTAYHMVQVARRHVDEAIVMLTTARGWRHGAGSGDPRSEELVDEALDELAQALTAFEIAEVAMGQSDSDIEDGAASAIVHRRIERRRARLEEMERVVRGAA